MNEQTRNLVENLMAEYVARIDNNELERWPELFTDKCLYSVTNRENHAQGYAHGAIWANSKGMLKDRVSALREANIYEEQVYRHIGDAVRLVSQDGDIVVVQSNFMVVRTMHTGDIHLFATGMYLDRIRLVDGAALFEERIVVCDSQKIDTLLAIPI